jgi:hypothetical protein
MARMIAPKLLTPMIGIALLSACGEKAPDLPTDALDRAATCGVVAAASERQAAGIKGDLPADGQARILHYAMLYASSEGALDQDKVNAVSARMPGLFDRTIKGKWQVLRPACAQAFPPSQVRQPVLPAKPLDSMLDCYVLADFLQKVLSAQGGSYVAAAAEYGLLKDRLDTKMAPLVRAAGLRNGPAFQQKRQEALAAAAKLGQPPALISACERKYPAPKT